MNLAGAISHTAPRVAVSIVVLYSSIGTLQAGAIAQASIAVSLQFPDAVTNQFGFSGPSTSLPDPSIDEIPDGVVHTAKRAAVTMTQLTPLVFLATAGPADVETTNDGDATAIIEGSLFGTLLNLSGSPLTVTFSFDIDPSLSTHVDMEGADFADAKVEASFRFGSATNFYSAESLNGNLISLNGLADGVLPVAIPGSSVDYRLDLYVAADVQSICDSSVCETPEPNTVLLLFPGIAVFLWKRGRSPKNSLTRTRMAPNVISNRITTPVPISRSPTRNTLSSTSRRAAPGAMRTPISCVCRVTVYAITLYTPIATHHGERSDVSQQDESEARPGVQVVPKKILQCPGECSAVTSPIGSYPSTPARVVSLAPVSGTVGPALVGKDRDRRRAVHRVARASNSAQGVGRPVSC